MLQPCRCNNGPCLWLWGEVSDVTLVNTLSVSCRVTVDRNAALWGPSGPLLLFHALVRVNRSKVLRFKRFRSKNLDGEWRPFPLTSIDVAVDVSSSLFCKVCCTVISCLTNAMITTINYNCKHFDSAKYIYFIQNYSF